MNRFKPTVCGIGYLGEGLYKPSIDHKKTRQYETWTKMLKRCYSKSILSKHPTYRECTVDKEWLNFQNFAKWYDKNFYHISNDRMALDKDILIKGNKVYSPSTCVFVNGRINGLFTKANHIRGDLPIGVTFSKHKGRFMSRCHDGGKMRYLGYFENPIDAFNKYKEYKENLIKEVANNYKSYIPEKLFKALMEYKVTIDD